MAIHVQSVTASAAARAELAFAIDRPKPAAHHDLLEISGWVVDLARPIEAIEVEVADLALARVAVDIERPDIPNHIPGASSTAGFEVLLGAINLEPTFELTVRAVRSDGSAVHLATISGTRDLASRYEPRIQPLMITTIGRTGSTWLMRLLSGHPQLAMFRTYPYEIRAAVYWLHAARVLTHPPERAEMQLGGDPILPDGKPWRVARNPYYYRPAIDLPELAAWFAGDYQAGVIEFAQRSIDGFYAQLNASEGRPAPAYFVEKFGPDQLSVIAASLYPRGREIFLVRDFRDVLASMTAFDVKRGVRSFGRERYDDLAFVGELARTAERLARYARVRAANALVVRYEDLIADPEATLARILGYAGLDSSPTLIASMVREAGLPSEAMSAHRTATTPLESIGRWRRDIPPERQAEASATLANALTAFGYAA